MNDDLVEYLPGQNWVGKVKVYENAGGGVLNTVYQSDPITGIAGYNLNQFQDRIIAFDFEHSGKMDYLFIYRANDRTCTILKNVNGIFSQVTFS